MWDVSQGNLYSQMYLSPRIIIIMKKHGSDTKVALNTIKSVCMYK